MMGWDDALILLIASWVISAALMPRPHAPDPTAFKDIDFPQVEEGTPQAVIFGDCWSGDWTVLAVGNYRTQPVTTDDGGK